MAHQAWNCPLQRSNMGWTLETPESWTHVQWPRGALLVKHGALLQRWRTTRCLAWPAAAASSSDAESAAVAPVWVIQFTNIPSSDDRDRQAEESDDEEQEFLKEFGYCPKPEDEVIREQRKKEPIPPLSELLTIVITTSPIKSNPSTEMLERTMDTFLYGGPEFAYECRKVIICDGFREKGDEADANDDGTPKAISRKHATAKQAMRNGIVTTDQARNYAAFKDNIRELAETAGNNIDNASVWSNVEVVELSTRHGYGYALRHSLQHCVTTPYVCVVQHDRSFIRTAPVKETIHALWRNLHIKYVGFLSHSNLTYKDIFRSKYQGDEFLMEQFDTMVERPRELGGLPADLYGPDSDTNLTEYHLKRRTAYKNTMQGALGSEARGNEVQCSLVPTLFWYDNVHICETAHYRDFVYHPTYKMVARGGFVEDKLSPVLKRTVERLGLIPGHARFGCYLLDDHAGLPFTGHLDGGSYIPLAAREAMAQAGAAKKKEQQKQVQAK